MGEFTTWLHIVIDDPDSCIGCRMCERNCPAGAITVENKKPFIDRDVCIACGMCVVKCPKKVIHEAEGAL